MEIRIRATGQVMTESEFRASHPNTSFPPVLSAELLDGMGADPVLEGQQASGGTVYQFSMRQGVEQINGKWFTKYVLGPVFTDTTDANGNTTTAAQHEADYKAAKDAEKATAVRSTRNALLRDSDWTQLYDTPGQTRAAYVQYRQSLRDVPAQAGFPWAVTWPTAP